MKQKVLTILFGIACMSMMLTGCGSDKSSSTTPAPTAEAKIKATESAEATKEAEVIDEPKETMNADTSGASTLSGKYVDLDNMQFMVNGKTYTLGKTTLQEMIDDKVPFKEEDIANASSDLKKDMQSQAYDIVLGEYWTVQIFSMNFSESSMKASECCISKIVYHTRKDNTQDILSFSFPFTITADDLIANAGNPTNTSNYDGGDDYKLETFEYMKESTKYYSDMGYAFDFLNKQFDNVTISYLP